MYKITEIFCKKNEIAPTVTTFILDNPSLWCQSPIFSLLTAHFQAILCIWNYTLISLFHIIFVYSSCDSASGLYINHDAFNLRHSILSELPCYTATRIKCQTFCDEWKQFRYENFIWEVRDKRKMIHLICPWFSLDMCQLLAYD